MSIEKLKKILESKINNLRGDWIKKNSSYDHFINEILGFEDSQERYWDSEFNGLKLEFKKGKSIWLDLVRYAEVFNKINDKAKEKTLTIFFIPNNDKNLIKEIICVRTDKIIQYLKFDKNIADILIYLNDKVPRSLNAQASLTVNDIKKIKDFMVTR